MFRQYQRQESAGSLSTIRTISGASQSSETMECVNGPPVEETAPSTVIELTVDELSQKSPGSASSSTITSSPLEAAGERGHASITVSNILARAEEEEQKLVQESSKDGSGDEGETEATVTQKNNKEEESEETEETSKQEPVTETSTDKSTDNLQTSVRDQAETDDTKAVEVVRDSATTSASDDAKTLATDDEKSESEPNKGDSSNSMTEDSLNEADTELPVVSEQEGQTDQTSPEACLENSVLGGASVFNEDLVDVSSVSDQVHPSDADDSQEESSYASAATGEEGEGGKKEEDKHEDDEGKKNDQEGHEMKSDEEKDEKQEVETQEETEEKQVSGSESQTPPAETPKEKDEDERPSSITETATADQQAADTTPPSTAQEVAAASDSTSPSQTSETTGTTEEETQSSPSDSSGAASNSGTQKSADSVSKTKEIKIARLDVSNVALDTERLELKETSTTVRIFFFTVFSTFDLSQNYAAVSVLNPYVKANCVLLVYLHRKQAKASQRQQQEGLWVSRERAALRPPGPPCFVSQSSAGPTCTNASSLTCSFLLRQMSRCGGGRVTIR